MNEIGAAETLERVVSYPAVNFDFNSAYNKVCIETALVRIKTKAPEGQVIFVNEYLVKEGYALLATYPPDVKYQVIFQKAQKYARKNNKGLWSVCEASS